MKEFYHIEVGYNGAALAGGDNAAEFEIDSRNTKWLVRVFLNGLRATNNTTSYLKVKGESGIVKVFSTSKESILNNLPLPFTSDVE